MNHPVRPVLVQRALVGCLLYCVLGWLAVVSHVPGQEVATLFLPAGLAIALVEVWGAHMLWAVFAGAFLLEWGVTGGLGTWTQLSLLSAPSPDLAHRWLHALACAVGATTQAGLGWYVVTRGRPQALALDTVPDIARLLLRGALLASLCHASLCTSIRVIEGSLPLDRAGTVLGVRWAGDAMGVALGTPIALSLLGRRLTVWRPRLRTVGLPLMLAALLLDAGAWQIGQARLKHQQERFDDDASTLANLVQLRLDAFAAPLHGFGAALSAPPTRLPPAPRGVGRMLAWAPASERGQAQIGRAHV